MNIYEVQLNLIALYENSKIDNSPFFEKVVGDLRVSVTHRQAGIINLATKSCVMMLMEHHRSSDSKDTKPYISFSDKHGNNMSCAIKMTGMMDGELEFIHDIPMYLPPGKSLMTDIWKIDDITEDFIFQQSTLYNLPEFKYFEQMKDFYNRISNMNRMCNMSVIMDLQNDWYNIPLYEDSFI